jgi:hypothetical protein
MPRTKSTKKTTSEAAAVSTVTPTPAVTSVPVATSTPVTATAPSKPAAPFAQEPVKKPTIVPSNPSKVATESRSKLVPINLDDEVRRLAYLMSERRGFEPGHEAEDWLNAEREVRNRYQQQIA